MKEKLSSELEGIGVGAGIMVLAPEAVESVFGELTSATGANLEFMPSDLPGFEHFYEAGIVEGTKALAVPVAVFLVGYAGFKHMISGGKEKKSFRVTDAHNQCLAA